MLLALTNEEDEKLVILAAFLGSEIEPEPQVSSTEHVAYDKQPIRDSVKKS